MRNLLVFISFHAYQTIAWNIFPSLRTHSQSVYLVLVKWSMQHKLFSFYSSDWIFRITIQIGWYRNYLSYTKKKNQEWFVFFLLSLDQQKIAKRNENNKSLKSQLFKWNSYKQSTFPTRIKIGLLWNWQGIMKWEQCCIRYKKHLFITNRQWWCWTWNKQITFQVFTDPIKLKSSSCPGFDFSFSIFSNCNTRNGSKSNYFAVYVVYICIWFVGKINMSPIDSISLRNHCYWNCLLSRLTLGYK